MSSPRSAAILFFGIPRSHSRRTSLTSSIVTSRNATGPPGTPTRERQNGQHTGHTEGGNASEKTGPRGGKVLKKSGLRGPYLLKIVTPVFSRLRMGGLRFSELKKPHLWEAPRSTG